MKKFKYIKALNENEIASIVDRADNYKFIAGGTDLLVNRFQSNENSDTLIDLRSLNTFNTISVENQFLKIGALVTLEELAENALVAEHFPVLQEAALSVATPVIRKTATVGGNVLCENRCVFYNQSEWWRIAAGNCLKCEGDKCIATGGKKNCFSKYVADVGAALICLNAEVFLLKNNAAESIMLRDIYTGDGVNPRRITPETIIGYLNVPLQKCKTVFKKLRPRKSLEFSSLTTVVAVFQDGHVNVVLGGVDPAPVLVSGTMKEKNELIAAAYKKARVVDNDFYSRSYRKEMIKTYLRESFRQLE